MKTHSYWVIVPCPLFDEGDRVSEHAADVTCPYCYGWLHRPQIGTSAEVETDTAGKQAE